MKQSLQLKLGQSLTMTPQLQQAIKLLQLSTLDLEQEIQSILESNPMLEVSEDSEGVSESGEAEQEQNATGDTSANSADESTLTLAADSAGETADENSDWQENIPEDLPIDTKWDEIYTSALPASPGQNTSQPFNEMPDLENREAHSESLSEHLEWQLNLTPMSDTDRLIAETIIDALLPSGLLSTTCEDLLASFDPEFEIELDEIEAVRHRIQQFDPLGVASLNLQDCLMVQLAQYPADTPWREQAAMIIHRHLPLLAARDFTQLMRRTRLKEKELGEVIELIRSLNPKPGDWYEENTAEYIVPDVYVKKDEKKMGRRTQPKYCAKN